jgi:hypothetical protein
MGKFLCLGLIASRVTESSFPSVTFPKQTHELKLRLNDRHEYHLRNSIARVNRESTRPAIPAGNEDLSLVIGVNEPDQVAEHEAILTSEPRAGQDGRRKPWIVDMNGKP